MRRFLILGHTQLSKAPISLNDAPGAGGRWDVLARCVSSALLVSHGARLDTEILLVLLRQAPPRVVRVVGSEIRNLNPDERSTIALLSKALETTDVADHETRALPGIYVSQRPLDRILRNAATEGPVILLREDAPMELERFAPTSTTGTFILSDHKDPTMEELGILRAQARVELTLGPVALQADQCISIVHNRLDRLGKPITPKNL